MVRKRYEINVWGTVLFLDIGSSTITESAMDQAVESVKVFVYEVDEVADALKDGVDLVARHLTTTALLENRARDITQRCLLRLHV